jgi:hypothetical protein
MKDLDDAHGRADLDGLSDERVRHAVEPVVEGDAVVDVDLGVPPLRELVAVCRQRPHRRPIDRLEDRAAASIERSARGAGRTFSSHISSCATDSTGRADRCVATIPRSWRVPPPRIANRSGCTRLTHERVRPMSVGRSDVETVGKQPIGCNASAPGDVEVEQGLERSWAIQTPRMASTGQTATSLR